jgi:glycosyltransferase involved in cell wall biosynthesis
MHMPQDVFHATDYRVVRMDCPVVATLHDALPIKHPEWCNPRLRGMKNWLQRKAAQKADHVIAVSHYAIDELVDCFGVDERRISVVPNGVDEEWLEAPAPAARWRPRWKPWPAAGLLPVRRHPAAAQERRAPAGCLPGAAASRARRAPAGHRRQCRRPLRRAAAPHRRGKCRTAPA